MSTLADLLSTQTASQIFSTLLGVYQANGFPTQSWQPFGVERTRLMAFSTALADVSGNYIPQAAAGGFLDYASTNWLRLTAAELYNIAYAVAGRTQGNIALTVAVGSGPYTYTAGSLIAVFAATGKRYLNVSGGTLSAGASSASILFQAEFTGASYSDPSNSGSITLATPLPGVTLSNPAGTFSTVAHVGSGTGTITLGGSPALPHQVIVRIDSTGASGVAAWSYSLDGAPYVSVGAVAGPSSIGSSGVTVTLVNGGSGTSFVLSDAYTFANPGTWVTTQGTDVEADLALATRCKNRWASLSSIPVNSLYQLLATSTPTVGAQVTQCIVSTDAVVNSQVNVVVAGPAGVLPVGVVAAIQTYINPRVPITDRPVVVSPSTLAVTLAGTLTCSASQLAAVQVAVQTAMTNYANATGINGTLRLAVITELLMQLSGMVDVSGLTINGAAANLTLGSSVSFVLPSLQTLGFTYVTV